MNSSTRKYNVNIHSPPATATTQEDSNKIYYDTLISISVMIRA